MRNQTTRSPAPTTPVTTAVHGEDAQRVRFREDGFLVIRGLLPPERILQLRQAYTGIVDRHQAAHPQEWQRSPQPRLHLHEPGLVDAASAAAVELWSDARVLAIASALLALPDPGVTQMALMCNPRVDHGPAGWHRDVHPQDMAPLDILQADLIENGPRYVQWNIPLYDDAVLWVVPGSHRRRTTEAEHQSLSQNACAPLPGGVPVELRAGDAAIYVNYILHWGSNYSAQLRRTIHGGHALFTLQDPCPPYLPHLDAAAASHVARWALRTRRLQDLTELALRSAIHRDAGAYGAALDGLHPGVGEAGRIALSCYLSKLVWRIRQRHTPGVVVPEELRSLPYQEHPITLGWGPTFWDRFSAEEGEILGHRFAWLDARLRAPQDQFIPGFQAGPMSYRFDAPAEPVTISGLLAAWG